MFIHRDVETRCFGFSFVPVVFRIRRRTNDELTGCVNRIFSIVTPLAFAWNEKGRVCGPCLVIPTHFNIILPRSLGYQ